MTQNLLDHIDISAFGQHIGAQRTPELMGSEAIEFAVGIENIMRPNKINNPLNKSSRRGNHDLPSQMTIGTSENKEHILYIVVCFCT